MPSTCLIVLCLLTVMAPPLAAQTPLDDRERQDALRHYRAGIEFLSGEEWEKAVVEFRGAIALDALFTDAYYGLGQSYMGLQRYVSAAQAFEGCLAAARNLHGLRERDRVLRDKEIDDELHEVRDTMRRMASQGGNRLRMQRLEKYISDLDRQRSSLSAPFQPPPLVLLALGSAHFRNGDSGRAQYYWREAVRFDSALGEAWNNLAAVYATSGRRQEAEHAVAQAERAGFRVNPRLKEEISSLK
jgi:tetratricopeptide (TPR) repeat protein